MQDLKIITGEDEVSALLLRPDNATHILVLAHGAGADMRHATMQTLAERLAENGITTLRYNFPFMERRGAVGKPGIAIATVIAAAAKAKELCPDLTILAGGHSYGGRMTSHAAAENRLEIVKGLIFCSFPLHPPEKPGTERAAHLPQITQPMLFLSGTRDALANLDLLEPVVKNLDRKAALHLLDTADHSYKVLKRSRESKEDVFVEIARVIKEWSLEFRV